MAQEHGAGLVVCVTGPESTGKTTLARALAEALGAPLVEEAARAMLTPGPSTHFGGSALPIAIHEHRNRDREIATTLSSNRDREIAPGGPSRGYTRADVLAIARAQLAAEAAALGTGAPVVIADTDLTVIRVWWEVKYGALDPWLVEAIGRMGPRRYLLTLPDLPWEPDPLRESPHDREVLLGRYRSLLAELAFPHAEIGGTGARRFELAFAAVQVWLRERAIPGLPGAAP